VSGGYENTAGAQAAPSAEVWQFCDWLFCSGSRGTGNTASGDYALAAGFKALAVNRGAFVWADLSGGSLSSTADNQFTVRASGGVRLFSDSGATTGVSLAPGSGSWGTLSDRNAKENFS